MCWSCDNPTKTFDDFVDEVVQPAIDRYGWFVQAVTSERGAPLAYTVGLTAMGLPELVVTGMAPRRAALLLNGMAAHWLHAEPLPAHGEHADTRGGQCLEVVDLPHPEAHLFTATGLYGDDAVAAQQLVWADDRGRWPWERGHRASRGGQPVLGARATFRRGRCTRLLTPGRREA
jgi:hypothetical protein